jgi:SAM-dependent methyltransferase
LDPQSAETTRSLVRQYDETGRCRVEERSVFDLDPLTFGTFDLVYSWGVLHHTGNLRLALLKAADMVDKSGRLVFALYRRTWMCPFWRIEKRWYSKTSPERQRLAQELYIRWFRFVGGRYFDVDRYIAEYGQTRGMDFYHDIHDWLGGYPYESVLPKQVDELVSFCML